MASLVADYGTSSGSDSDSDESTQNPDSKCDKKTQAVNLLVSAPVDDDSDSNDSPANSSSLPRVNSCQPNAASMLPNPLAASPKLPSPALGHGLRPETSVFVTSFHRAEEAKSSILEQHVKMTDSDLPAEVDGKKICWNFRKGKCRFGHKCRFSHGVEIRGQTIQGGSINGEVEEQPGSVPSPRSQKVTGHGRKLDKKRNSHGYLSQNHKQNHSAASSQFVQGHSNYMPSGCHQPWPQGSNEAVPDEDDYLLNAKRKKRAGVTDTMVPPKRAMRDLDRFRAEERPWTVKK